MALVDYPSINRLSDGRLNLRHGPIHLVVEAFGSSTEVEAAYQQATNCFSGLLTELVSELSELRKQPDTQSDRLRGKIATDMHKVASAFSARQFITPMIAVAGAVADHVLAHMTLNRSLSKAYVNNGGDIAIYLTKHNSFTVGVCANPLKHSLVSNSKITEFSDIRGIATSGWRGRSHSLGIADSVTVLARTSAVADAAATLIANAINLPNHPAIKRAVATELNPDSDLGDHLVTIDVGYLTAEETLLALESGRKHAQAMIDTKQIIAVYGSLNSQVFSLHPLEPADELSNPQFNRIEKEQPRV